MASSVIKAPEVNASTTGTVNTSYATSSRTDYVNKLMRVGNLVFITLAVGFTNGIATGNFAQIPEGFRPKANQSVTAIVKYQSDGDVYPISASINASTGVLSQSIGTAKYIQIDTVYEA